MPTITYRDATPADAPILADLGRRTFVETFGHLYTPENLAAFLLNHAPEKWAADLADPNLSVRLVEDKGTPAGYAKVGPKTLPYEANGPAAELSQFYLLKPWHGSGIAQELMAWTLAEARRRGAEELFLSVYVDNHRARRFYERYGFQFVGPYAFMVGTQADEDHVMRLSLKEPA
ncbi:MAG TPA: GNAT family N-acetyltransferase [Allosphingosinicella sp.]